jgi:hypothetical protein
MNEKWPQLFEQLISEFKSVVSQRFSKENELKWLEIRCCIG